MGSRSAERRPRIDERQRVGPVVPVFGPRGRLGTGWPGVLVKGSNLTLNRLWRGLGEVGRCSGPVPLGLLQGVRFAEVAQEFRAVQCRERWGVFQVSEVGEEWHAAAEWPLGQVSESDGKAEGRLRQCVVPASGAMGMTA